METRVDEIAERIYRLSTFVPDIGPTGFTFNQFLIDADEPTIFHTGPRGMFPAVSEAIASLHAARSAALDHVRPSRSRRVRRDEPFPRGRAERPGGPHRHRLHGVDRRPRRPAAGPIATDGSFDLGGRRIRSIDTPHVPHGWDAHVLYEETTGTLFCGDLLSQVGDGPALTGGRPCRCGHRRPRTCSARPVSRLSRRPPSAASLRSSRPRSRSCTAPRTAARPAMRSSPSPTTSSIGWPKSVDHPPDNAGTSTVRSTSTLDLALANATKLGS